MANIGNLAWVLSANPAPLQKGLDVAKSSLASFAQAAGKLTGNDLAKGIKAAGGAVTDALVSVITNPLGAMSGALKAIPWAGELLALPVAALQGVMGFYAEGAARIKDVGAAAARTGSDMQSMQALMIVAGGSTEGMEKALIKMNANLGEAQSGSKTAEMAFKRLGLSSESLAKMSAAERFGTVADAINKINDPTVRATTGVDIFGRQFVNIAGAVAKGSEGIRTAAEKMDQFGLGFGAQDLASIRAADMAMKDLKMLWTGIVNQLTIAVGPILAELASKSSALVKSVADIFGLGDKGAETMSNASGTVTATFGKTMTWADTIVNGIEKVAVGFAWLIDVGVNFGKNVMKLGGAFITWKDYALDSIQAVLDGIDAMVKKAAEAFNLMARFHPGAKAQKWAMKKMGFDTDEMAKEGIGAGGVLDSIMERGEGAMGRLQGLATSYWSALTPTSEAQNAVRGFFDGVRNRMKSAADAAKQTGPDLAKILPAHEKLQDEFGSPFEKAQKKISELQDQWRQGFFMGRTDLFNTALTRAYGEMEKTALPPVKAPAAILEGSKEAYSAVLAFQREGQQGSVQEQMKAILEQTKQVQQQQAATSKEILEAMRALQRR